MTKKLAVFIGRFNPLHNGHLKLMLKALEQADRLLILIGSSNTARSLRNPFTAEERLVMIINALYEAGICNSRVVARFLPDHPRDTVWESAVRNNVNDVKLPDETVVLAGYAKDGTSYYLRKFPEWDSISIEGQHMMLSSTHVRDAYFKSPCVIPEHDCPPAVCLFLKAFRETEEYNNLWMEAKENTEYKKKWEASPFPPVFVTVDAVCVQSGHILLVTRGDYPGKGLLALPGGFLNPGERIFDGAIRELREETLIEDHLGKMPPAKLESYVEAVKVFDDPHRSSRGRTITHAHLFRFPDAKTLFKVKGNDDAAHAQWYPISDLDPTDFFEDHFCIIQDMLGL